MALTPGTHALGPADGSIEVHTFREGVAQRVGHDLIIGVGRWQANVEVGGDGQMSGVTLEVDSGSLEVREGLHGVKPLSDKDRADIARTINEKILGGQPITFRSDGVEHSGTTCTARGQLTLVGTARPATFTLSAGDDGRLHGTVEVTQTDFGIKPYRGLMGALKVRDTVEIALDARVPAT